MRRAVARARGARAVRCEGGGCSERITTPSHKSAGLLQLENGCTGAPKGTPSVGGWAFEEAHCIVQSGIGPCVRIARVAEVAGGGVGP